MSRLITNRDKQKGASDQTVRKQGKFLKHLANRRIRRAPLEVARVRPSPGRDPLSIRKRSGRCRVCLAMLRKNAKRTRYECSCGECGASLQPKPRCRSCGTARVWVGPLGSRCKGCGKPSPRGRLNGRTHR